jgi:uncharacterized protein (TIGR02996 family)
MTTEQSFLNAIRENPSDEHLRLVYADWLEEQGDERAEFLRIEAEIWRLSRRSKRYGELKMRRTALWKRLVKEHAAWLAMLDHASIDFCALRFAYECPKQWQNLQRTENDAVRFCEVCQKQVYYCTTLGEARQRAGCGECVAIDTRIDSTRHRPAGGPRSLHNLYGHRIGRVAPPRSRRPRTTEGG